MTCTAGTPKAYATYGQVYLAKNNNAVLRLKSMLPLNPDMTVFVLVRDPLQHAFSLMKQHQKFEKEQTEDPFILEYMNWLGHHEFGQGQLPFNLSGSGPTTNRSRAAQLLARALGRLLQLRKNPQQYSVHRLRRFRCPAKESA